MREAELFSGPILTPEQKVAQNARLRLVDEDMQERARIALIEQQGGPEALQKEKDELITRLRMQAPEAALRMATELDPDFMNARNILVSRIVQKPSRLPFLNKDVPVLEQVEVAAWNLFADLKINTFTFLGHDGELYEMPNDTLTTIRPLILSTLEAYDLMLLEKSIAEYLDTQELRRQ